MLTRIAERLVEGNLTNQEIERLKNLYGFKSLCTKYPQVQELIPLAVQRAELDPKSPTFEVDDTNLFERMFTILSSI
jgi:F0F1-type ATP synthase gamma subunit